MFIRHLNRFQSYSKIYMNTKLPFRLFSNCQLVKGAERSTICDVQRNRFHLIPNSLFDLLAEFQGSTITQIKQHFNNEYDEIVDEYFDLLIKEELIFFSNNHQLFPPLNLQWDSPSEITYALIDIGQIVYENFDSIATQLDELDCKYVELRSYQPLSIEKLNSMLISFDDFTVISVSLVVHHNDAISTQEWRSFCDNHKRITSLFIHSSIEEKDDHSTKYLVPISYKTQKISSELCCGVIHPGGFVSFSETFTESLRFNSCLNKKIGIDQEGNIKNCPSMKNSFGNILDTNLREVLTRFEFTQVWNYKKDLIEVCKDCEFRHVCTDCRAFLDKPEDNFSKPLKCGYDPYSCEWEPWSMSPLKQNAIMHYGLSEIGN